MVTGVIHTVTISDQRVSQRAQIHQVVPIGVAPGQPRDLDAQHQPHMPKANLSNQPLKPTPAGKLRTTPPLVLIDHHNPLAIPPQ